MIYKYKQNIWHQCQDKAYPLCMLTTQVAAIPTALATAIVKMQEQVSNRGSRVCAVSTLHCSQTLLNLYGYSVLQFLLSCVFLVCSWAPSNKAKPHLKKRCQLRFKVMN
jgi:hypothetical protein